MSPEEKRDWYRKKGDLDRMRIRALLRHHLAGLRRDLDQFEHKSPSFCFGTIDEAIGKAMADPNGVNIATLAERIDRLLKEIS